MLDFQPATWAENQAFKDFRTLCSAPNPAYPELTLMTARLRLSLILRSVGAPKSTFVDAIIIG